MVENGDDAEKNIKQVIESELEKKGSGGRWAW